MPGRGSLSRWTKHPAFYVFGIVFLLRDLILAGLALSAVVAGGVAQQGAMSIVAVVLGVLALTGVVASFLTGQRRSQAQPAAAGRSPGAQAIVEGGPVPSPVRETPGDARAERAAPATPRSSVADQLISGRQLRAEICDAQERGAWDDEGWAYRRRVEAWTARTADVLAQCGRSDLARALADVEAPPRPPFEGILKGYSASYARLVGLLDGRIGLLERSQG